MENVISKGAYRVLCELTKETRVEAALHMALKQLLTFQKDRAEGLKISFERKYNIDFPQFEEAWKEDNIPQRYSFEVENDYAEWEAAITDLKRLEELDQWLV